MADDFARQLIDHLPRLRRFAISLTRSRDLADDLVQTACEKAWASRASFVPGTRLDAWLFRILRNTWIDRARRASSEGHSVDIEDAYGLVGQDGRERTEQRLMLDAAAKAIATLPDDQREVLVFVGVEDLSYREVMKSATNASSPDTLFFTDLNQNLFSSFGSTRAPYNMARRFHGSAFLYSPLMAPNQAPALAIAAASTIFR
jgi:RNA polymerase sigma-70 factor (ECF subfamily)